MMGNKIELGDKVKCKYTGYIGYALAKTEFINGCIQFTILPKWDKKGPNVEGMEIDENSLIVIKKAKKDDDEEDDESGGPSRLAVKQRGY